MQGYFNMMMLVDTSGSLKQHNELADELKSLGEEIGVQIKAQKEEIFHMMHRI
jgi:ACT domain-containing protein